MCSERQCHTAEWCVGQQNTPFGGEGRFLPMRLRSWTIRIFLAANRQFYEPGPGICNTDAGNTILAKHLSSLDLLTQGPASFAGNCGAWPPTNLTPSTTIMMCPLSEGNDVCNLIEHLRTFHNVKGSVLRLLLRL